jgi:tetratricopeptide (TPR) repeat protein
MSIALAVLVLVAPVLAFAQTPVERARALIATYHEDPHRIDEARDLLEEAITRERPADAVTLLSRIYFLAGEVRATSDDEKLAAFGRGRDLGKLAIEIAPRSEEAHVWYALNLGRWGQTKGMMRSLFLLPTIREELDTVFSINPRSVRGHALAGNVFFELPGMMGGDRKKAEEHFRKGIEADPHFTVLRLDLARLLVAEGRIAEARRELERVVNETAPTNVADWTARDRPRARTRLDELRDRK